MYVKMKLPVQFGLFKQKRDLLRIWEVSELMGGPGWEDWGCTAGSSAAIPKIAVEKHSVTECPACEACPSL